MDYISLIKKPIKDDLEDFIGLFNDSLSHTDGMLSQVLEHIRKSAGKRMRPMLILLVARNYGQVSEITQHAAVGLELLHTASLVHDDVVDESGERRGQASVNATYNNKVAVLVGDFILSTALLNVSLTHKEVIVRYLANLGRTLSNGEILQLTNISNQDISETVYYQVIKQKTAALFEACAGIGALSAGASKDDVEKAKKAHPDALLLVHP
ncbi:MAG TPA: polyprenyl synthetase family protein, partial [Xylanibacter oryzae]|nr:polyprenyl synthetase family protein [Xylanibacter oryzae]